MHFTESPIWKRVREMDGIIEKCDAVRMEVNSLRLSIEEELPRAAVAVDYLHDAHTALRSLWHLLEDADMEITSHAERDDEERNNAL